MTSSDPDLILQSGKLPDGTYQIMLTRGKECWPIARDQVNDYVAGVLAVASWADHDAAVVRQLIANGGDQTLVAHVILALRDLRRPAPGDTRPLELAGGVSSDGECRPFLVVSLAGERVGQWTPVDAQRHCVAVLGLLATVDLDDAYHEFLTTEMGLEPERAQAVVNGLQRFRTMA